MSEVETKLATIQQSLDILLEDCSVSVSDAESEGLAANMLVAVRTKLREIETERKSWTDPLEQQKKRLIGEFKKLSEPLVRAETHLSNELTKYRNVLLAAAQKEEERLRRLQDKRNERAAEKGKPSPLPETIIPYVPTPEKTISTQNGKLTYTTRWHAELVDIAKVPMFLHGVQIVKVDMVAVNGLVNAGIREIPGFKITQETHTRISG